MEAGHALERNTAARPTASCTCWADHAEPEEEKEMFDLQRTLLLTFLAGRGRPV